MVAWAIWNISFCVQLYISLVRYKFYIYLPCPYIFNPKGTSTLVIFLCPPTWAWTEIKTAPWRIRTKFEYRLTVTSLRPQQPLKRVPTAKMTSPDLPVNKQLTNSVYKTSFAIGNGLETESIPRVVGLISILLIYFYCYVFTCFILQTKKFLECDWLRPVVFKPNLKYLHVKITASHVLL